MHLAGADVVSGGGAGTVDTSRRKEPDVVQGMWPPRLEDKRPLGRQQRQQ